jgi:uncharacterized membrane protein
MGASSKSDFRRVDKYVSLPPMTSRPVRWTFAGLLFVYAVVMFAMACRRFQVFAHDTGDIAFYDNVFWWTTHGGRPFFSTLADYNTFGQHAAFFLVLLAPFYWLVPGPTTLAFLQTACLTLSAIPVFLISRRAIQDERWAVWLALTYLLLPGIGAQNVNQFEEPCFVPIFLMWGYYFFLEERFGMFVLFGVLTCSVRENAPLAVVMFGVYALMVRRSWKWVLTPLIGAGVYFVLVIEVVMPWFRAGHLWHCMQMFQYLGKTPGQIVFNALTHPLAVLSNLGSLRNTRLMVFLFGPMLLLPLLSPASLLALPDLAIFLGADYPVVKTIQYHYHVTSSAALFVGAILALPKAVRWLNARFGDGPWLNRLTQSLLIATLAVTPIWIRPKEYIPRANQAALDHALQAVPPGRSVIVPLRLVSRVSQRPHFANLAVLKERPEYAAQFEYILLDSREERYTQGVKPGWNDSEYEKVFAEDGVYVYRRRAGEGDWKYRPDWIR